MDSNTKTFWSNRNAEFLAFTFLEVRFLVDLLQQQKSLTNAIGIVMIPYFFD